MPDPRPADPGSDWVPPKPHTLEWIIDFIRRHPGASTRTGEADMLVAEIDRLRKKYESPCEHHMVAVAYEPDGSTVAAAICTKCDHIFQRSRPTNDNRS